MVRLIAIAVMVPLGPFIYSQMPAAPATSAQDASRNVPPQKTDPLAPESLTVTLRNAPFNMEPIRQPGSVRVDNRTTVILKIENLSPLDACSPTRTPTATAETSPFQALLTAVTGFGGIGLGEQKIGNAEYSSVTTIGIRSQYIFNGKLLDRLNEKDKITNRTIPAIEKDIAYTRFTELWKTFKSGKDLVTGSDAALIQVQSEQRAYDQSARDLLTYIAADYRGDGWRRYNPECLATADGVSLPCDPRVSKISVLINNPLSSVDSVANVQGTLDILSNLDSYLHKTYEAVDKQEKPPKETPRLPESLDTLQEVDRELDSAKTIVTVLNDGVGLLKTAQTSLRAAYLAAGKIQEDSLRRMGMEVTQSTTDSKMRSAVINASLPVFVKQSGNSLYQDIQLGSDRKTTVNGTVVCVSQTDQKTPTVDTINYSILYQDLPPLSISAGVLLTFQQKQVIGVTDVTTDGGVTSVQKFAVTDSARAQVFPMAFVNYHPGKYGTYATLKSGRTGEERLLTSLVLTGGIGVNSNSGKNQPEFFAGPSLMFNKMVISAGAHFGRVQSLGGGFTLGDTVPSTLKDAPPVSFQYKPAFAIGLSYRLAPW